MPRCLPPVLLATALSAALGAAPAQPDPAAGKPQMFGKTHPFTLDDLPEGRFRSQLESLSPTARARALEWLHRFDFPLNDLGTLHVDDEGGVFYADPAFAPPAE